MVMTIILNELDATTWINLLQECQDKEWDVEEPADSVTSFHVKFFNAEDLLACERYLLERHVDFIVIVDWEFIQTRKS
jgi:hypothetical protein